MTNTSPQTSLPNNPPNRFIMKNRQPILALVLLCVAAQFTAPTRLGAADANPPKQLTYQGFLTDGSGVPLGNSAPANHVVVFRIFNAETGGTVRWSEQQTVTLDKGHFSVLLGEGSVVGSEPNNPDLTGVFAGNDASDRFMEITVDGATINPRLQFQPAPYAMLAKGARQVVDSVGNTVLTATAGDLTASGTIAAAGFSGSGANLTGIKNSAIASSAAIADSKLATISTSGKVANSATTATTSNNANTIVQRNGSGNFSAGTITATGLNAGTVSASSITTSGNVTVNSPGKLSGFGTIPLGGIIMWSGATVPNGWQLCNGNNGTPDLRNRFIVGSGSTYSIGNKGGANSVTLTQAQTPLRAHTHTVTDFFDSDAAVAGASNAPHAASGNKEAGGDGGASRMQITQTTSNPVGSFPVSAHENRPPYFALAFIMRVE